MTDTAEVWYDDVPPSMNSSGSGYRGNPQAAHRVKKKWEGIFAVLLMSAKVPRRLTSVHANASLRFPQARRRDEGNYRMLIEKALGDALARGGWIEDDTPDAYSFHELQFEDDKGPKRTTLFLELEGPALPGARSTDTQGG